ncbi:DCL family protein [Bartonella sp. HY406]|uniref:DCL family protein n=1 Tax=Bartonella sp. HY406 TaxID=2979331 RepID=UPI0021CA5115|nr:DCL family protein [Bartonella sp. HY406]UXN05115.1 DCL family protein [Bartonella sp. HY406]
MAKSVELTNGRKWKSQNAARQHFKDMLARYRDDQPILDHSDHSDLSALLERFDLFITDGPSKIGSGIKYFERRINKDDGWSSPGFWVIRIDNTSTDFSYIKAITGLPKSKDEEFYKACHNAVSQDLINMKQQEFKKIANADDMITCDITGSLITYSDTQLSHAHPPFGLIVKNFLKLKGWENDIPSGILTSSADAQLSTHFSDNAISNEFKIFHHSQANLRLISKKISAQSTPPHSIIHRSLIKFK